VLCGVCSLCHLLIHLFSLPILSASAGTIKAHNHAFSRRSPPEPPEH
jgi:hypothetical protein